MVSFDGQAVIVTGAASGIGLGWRSRDTRASGTPFSRHGRRMSKRSSARVRSVALTSVNQFRALGYRPFRTDRGHPGLRTPAGIRGGLPRRPTATRTGHQGHPALPGRSRPADARARRAAWRAGSESAGPRALASRTSKPVGGSRRVRSWYHRQLRPSAVMLRACHVHWTRVLRT